MKKDFNVARTFASRVGAIAGAGVIAMTMWVGFGGSMGAAPRAFIPEDESCLPTCVIDGRHLVVAGDDNTTLAATAITIGLVFTEESLEPNGNFQLFDGDRDPANWDVPFNDGSDPFPDADAPQLIVELWADPNGNGAEGLGASLVAFWTPDAANVDPLNQGAFPTLLNDWAGVSFVHSPAALEDGVADGTGIYQYAVRILPYLPLQDKGWNAFKVRANGTVTLIDSQVVGFIASMGESQADFDAIYPPVPGFPASTYSGEWEFNTTLPAGLEDVTVFDGDMDFGNARFVAPASVFCDYKDTDDADTPATPPGFANAAAFPEGIATGGAACTNTAGTASGQPADDTDALAYQRVPTIPGVPNGIAYRLEAPDGQVFLNRNPSGNREWEQFKIQKVTHVDDLGVEPCPVNGFAQTAGYDPVTDLPTDREYPASDCRTMTLPGGAWVVRLDGMDMQNLNFWFFSFKVEPIDPPCEGEECDVCIGEPETVSLKGTSVSSTDGPDGNTRLFDANTIRASAWARNRSTGVWSPAWLGQYGSSGLGVTDNSEGDGSSNRHVVDNAGAADNYVLFEFASPVTPDKVELTFIQGDADISVWIGTKPDAFTAAQTLSDAYLTSLGFTEVADGSTSSGTRTAEINAGSVSGNILIVAAQTGTETNDAFKVTKLITGCPPPPAPSIAIIKKTNGTDNDTGTGPIVAIGSTVTWTYIVTNTGNVDLTGVTVTDDKVGAICTIGTLLAGATAVCNKTGTAVAGHYVNVGTVTGTPPTGPPVSATNPDRYFGEVAPCVPGAVGLTGSSTSSTDGSDGNTRLFNNSTIRASAWSRSRTTGAWSKAWLGLYGSSGLGVTDSSEGSGSTNRHIVDNAGGRDNYVLLEFKTAVTIDRVGLNYIQGDADITVWIGTKADAFTSSQNLTDAYLTSLGFTQVNDSSVSSGSRSADINAGNVSGNIVIVAAQTGSETNDGFKISSVTLACPAPSAPAPAAVPAAVPASIPAPATAMAPKALWLM